jgi:hypothetical protein
MTTTAPIKGYRELSTEELRIANEVKELAELVGEKVEEIFSRTDTDKRWAAIARTDLQTGFMALIRSVLRPTTF